MIGLFYLATLGTALTVYLTKRRHQTLRCDVYLSRLRPFQLKSRQRFLDDPDCPDVWEGTDGLRGIYYRWCNRTVFLGLCQIRVMRHGLERKEVRYVTRRAAKLTAYTALLVLLYPFHKLKRVERLARNAFVLYSEMAFRTHAFYADDDEPVCSLRLATLL